jgi:hypothetical protein
MLLQTAQKRRTGRPCEPETSILAGPFWPDPDERSGPRRKNRGLEENRGRSALQSSKLAHSARTPENIFIRTRSSVAISCLRSAQGAQTAAIGGALRFGLPETLFSSRPEGTAPERKPSALFRSDASPEAPVAPLGTGWLPRPYELRLIPEKFPRALKRFPNPLRRAIPLRRVEHYEAETPSAAAFRGSNRVLSCM